MQSGTVVTSQTDVTNTTKPISLCPVAKDDTKLANLKPTEIINETSVTNDRDDTKLQEVKINLLCNDTIASGGED